MNRAEFLKLSALFPVVAKSVFSGIADGVSKDLNEVTLSDIDAILIKSKDSTEIIPGKFHLHIEKDLIDVSMNGGWSDHISAPPKINIECIATKRVDDYLSPIYAKGELIEYEYMFLANGQKMTLSGKGYISGLYRNEFEIHPSGEVVLGQ